MASANKSTDSPWQTIGAAALLGTTRQPFQMPIASGALGQYLSQLNNRPQEAALLGAAGMVALHQRVGWLPVTQSTPEVESVKIEPCPRADLPRCSSHAARCLQQILSGQFSQQFPQLLGEWLAKAQIHGQRVPEMLLPALLDKGRSPKELHPAISAVLGQRGQWLAAQNSDWHYAIAITGEADWETGTPEARLALLQNLRTHDPDRARELLQTSWSQESAADRAQFLETFRIGLSLADEPFLEVALNDRRSKTVRQVAADLLASLPESRLCQQMANLIQSYMTFSPGSPASIEVQLPDVLPPELIKLGIDSNSFLLNIPNLGGKANWLQQMIVATPLSFWNRWGMTAEALVTLAQQSEWQTVLLWGWAMAAQRQGDRIWSIALAKREIASIQSGQNPTANRILNQTQLENLFRLLSFDQQNDLLLSVMRSTKDAVAQPSISSLLFQNSGEWSVELTEAVLNSLKYYVEKIANISQSAWDLGSYLHQFAFFIPMQCLPDFLSLQSQVPTQPYWERNIDQFLLLLQFRKEIIRAFEGDGG